MILTNFFLTLLLISGSGSVPQQNYKQYTRNKLYLPT